MKIEPPVVEIVCETSQFIASQRKSVCHTCLSSSTSLQMTIFFVDGSSNGKSSTSSVLFDILADFNNGLFRSFWSQRSNPHEVSHTSGSLFVSRST